MACSSISKANSLVLGVIQMMIGIFHVLMWYFLLVLYTGQIKGTFGIYEPVTYKVGCALWGIFYILAGAFTVSSAKQPNQCLVLCALTMNILAIILVIVATALTLYELSHFETVSYRNFAQAKLGREVSRVLLLYYPLEFAVALTCSSSSCSWLGERRRDNQASVRTEMDDTSF